MKKFVIVLLLSALALTAVYVLNSNALKAQKVQHKPTPTKTTHKTTHKTYKPHKPKFTIEVLGVKSSGTFSRTITAKLENKDGDAKNVRVTLELFVGKDRIKVNGKDALTINVGNMKAGSSVVKNVEISVGFFDALKIKSAGYVVARLTIIWDGGREVYQKKIRV